MREKVIAAPIPYGIVPDRSEDYFVVGSLSPRTKSYLSDITDGSPIELIHDPLVFLSPPSRPIARDQVDAVLSGAETLPPVELWYRCARSLYNPVTARTERIVAFQPLDDGEGFYPYFVWAEDPNRSLSCRNFFLSLDNSMHSDRQRQSYVVYPRLVKVSSPEGGQFSILVNAEIDGSASSGNV